MQIVYRLIPIHKFVTKGKSMEPTIKEGSIVFVNTYAFFFTKPKVNDIIAVFDPRDKKILIKRIKVFKEKRYFIEGDNKQRSTDSREFGMIKRGAILGKVFFNT